MVARCSNLKIGVSTGQRAFEEDQEQLIGTVPDPLRTDKLFHNDAWTYNPPGPLGVSLVDVLVCTPGRLQEHVQYSPGFTLQHLRFLVLDEADRLLGNAYHSWVRTIVKSTHNGGSLVSPAMSSTMTPFEHLFQRQRPLQRLLFSATMTDNPRKLALLGITHPLMLRIGADPGEEGAGVDQTEDSGRGDDKDAQYVLPMTLSEYVCHCDTSKRPLLLLAILSEAFGIVHSSKSSFQLDRSSNAMVVIFSSSVDTTHRLCRLLQIANKQCESWSKPSELLFGGRVCEMSRLLDNETRVRVMTEASLGQVKVLVSSDHMSRGIDLPNIALVVNYDPPKQAKTYVHRVGRTARAGKEGAAVTMLKVGQAGSFRKLRSDIIGGRGVDKLATTTSSNDELVVSIYEGALKRLPEVFGLEDNGSLRTFDDVKL
jgi:ATP-dependent RNA helicase DDX51/DBP6